MNNQRAIDRLTKHLEWGWSKKTVDAIEMGIHALKETQWIPCSERLPEEEEYILLSFANYTGLDIGRYENDGENDKFYPGDDEETYAHYGLVVNASMPYQTVTRWQKSHHRKKQADASGHRHATKS